jgi:protein-disulfide isomerase
MAPVTFFNKEHEALSGFLATDHSTGADLAGIFLLEFGGYECPSCSEAEPLTRHLVESFGDRIRFAFRHFPLNEVDPHAELAAEAAAAEGKFWQMHHLLFPHWQHLQPTSLSRYATMAGLDMPNFDTVMADRRYRERIQEQRRTGERLGLRGSPTFFLDGQVVDVSFGVEHIEAAVRTALEL